MRYRIRRGAFGPLLALFGGTEHGSFVDLDPVTVWFRFGPLFDERIPRVAVAGARRSRWPWYGGIGWRLSAGGIVGLIGALDGVVEVELREPRRVRVAGIPWRCRRIFVSLELPDAFLAELGA